MIHALPPRLPESGETREWAKDNQAGRERAGELIAFVRQTGNPVPLCQAIGDIVRRGNYGAAEIGFFYKVAMSTI